MLRRVDPNQKTRRKVTIGPLKQMARRKGPMLMSRLTEKNPPSCFSSEKALLSTGCHVLLILTLWLSAGTHANTLEDSGLTLAQQRESSLSEWRFKVFLDQREIGFHDFRVSILGEQLRMETTAEFDVKILFFNAYRYRHKNVELWNSDCLTALDSSTDANGDDFMISGAVNNGRFIVSDGTDTESLPPCVQSFAYWNPKFLNATNLLNSQTGELESVSINFEDEDVVQVNGTGINAHRYVIKAKAAAITLWYASADARWLALQSIDDNGRTIRYVPQVIPELEP